MLHIILSLLTDMGLVLETPLRVDLRETILRLDRFLPFDPSLMEGLPIAENEFQGPGWLSRLEDLFSLPRNLPKNQRGAEQVARFTLKKTKHSNLLESSDDWIVLMFLFARIRYFMG